MLGPIGNDGDDNDDDDNNSEAIEGAAVRESEYAIITASVRSKQDPPSTNVV